MFLAFSCKRSLVYIFLNLIRQMILLTLVATTGVDVRVMILFNESFKPGTIHTTLIFLGNEVCDVLYITFKAHPFLFGHQYYTGFVALTFCAPVVGIDG